MALIHLTNKKREILDIIIDNCEVQYYTYFEEKKLYKQSFEKYSEGFAEFTDIPGQKELHIKGLFWHGSEVEYIINQFGQVNFFWSSVDVEDREIANFCNSIGELYRIIINEFFRLNSSYKKSIMSRKKYGWHHYLEEYLNDKHVFDFIKSDECYSFALLEKYLDEHNLFSEERYFFYMAGKYKVFPGHMLKKLSQYKEFAQNEVEEKV